MKYHITFRAITYLLLFLGLGGAVKAQTSSFKLKAITPGIKEDALLTNVL
ncbi:hypothetical protein HQN84_18690 [Pedobacter steynii]|nr:hypothetical protein [Pedobacter steynii]NQX40884.1 hypothetical protein [Pedobacter steynii]